jgi:hypothetical protein
VELGRVVEVPAESEGEQPVAPQVDQGLPDHCRQYWTVSNDKFPLTGTAVAFRNNNSRYPTLSPRARYLFF